MAVFAAALAFALMHLACSQQDIVDRSIATIPSVVIEGDGSNSCPSNEVLEAARQTLTNATMNIFSMKTVMPECGTGLWTQVVSLDMSDSAQQCPSPWMEFATPARSCGRPSNSDHGCNGVSFSVNIEYRRVCGRAIGDTPSSPDGFMTFGPRSDENYVDGISVTHSTTREHIWTFAADHAGVFRCPCSSTDAVDPPSFVGDNYFCDTTRNGKFWDGEGCVVGETECCQFNSPPWFSVRLPAVTSDDIEVRICADEHTSNENIVVELFELFVQ